MSSQEEDLLLDSDDSFSNTISTGKESSLRNTYLAAVSALLYIVVLGMAISFTAPASIDMQNKGSRFYGISLTEITWIASLPTLTSGLGNILSSYFANKYGRKAVIILVSAPYLISWLMIIYAPTLLWIYCGRLLTGFCYGVCSVAITAYCVEISTVSNRGFITASFHQACVIGVLLMDCLGFGARWSWMATTCAIILTCATCLFYFMPESPHWLIQKHKHTEALRSLMFLRGKNSDFKKEFQTICRSQRHQQEQSVTFKSFKEPTLYKPTVIAISLFFFQQFSGINSLNAYIVEIFQKSGGNVNAQVSAVIFALVQVVTSICNCFAIDKIGRRPLYITSGSLITVSLAVLGVHSFLLEHGFNVSHLQWVPLTGLLLYIIAFSFGFGPLAIVFPAEMVPIHSRSIVLAIAIIFAAIFGFMVMKSFDLLIHSLGYCGLYWTYAIFSCLGTFFGIFCLPETKGKTIEEINNSFSR